MFTRGMRLWQFLWRRVLVCWYRPRFTRVGPGVVIDGPLVLRNEGSIILGQGCRLSSSLSQPVTLEAIAGATISLGEDTYINRGTVIAGRKSITVERGVAISDQCLIYDTDWHPLPDDPDQSRVPTAPVVIGEGAWIGSRTVILKGVTIGAHAVVGAGSVVTRSLPPYCVAAGNPARVIRMQEGHEAKQGHIVNNIADDKGGWGDHSESDDALSDVRCTPQSPYRGSPDI